MICKTKYFWFKRLINDFPVVDTTKISNPRDVYFKILDAKTDSQKKFEQYLYNGDYTMRDILPKIYHVIWPRVGIIYQDEFMLQSPLYTPFGKFRRGLELFQMNTRDMFEAGFKIGLKMDDLFWKYKKDINTLKNLYSRGRPDWKQINQLVGKLSEKIPNLRYKLVDAIKTYLYENKQVYDLNTPIDSLY